MEHEGMIITTFNVGDRVRLTFGDFPVQTVSQVGDQFVELLETHALVWNKDLRRVEEHNTEKTAQ